MRKGDGEFLRGVVILSVGGLVFGCPVSVKKKNLVTLLITSISFEFIERLRWNPLSTTTYNFDLSVHQTPDKDGNVIKSKTMTHLVRKKIFFFKSRI